MREIVDILDTTNASAIRKSPNTHEFHKLEMGKHPMRRLTMVGTLPPNVGISEVCVEQLRHLTPVFDIEFLDFRKLYPESLHPGQVREPNVEFIVPSDVKLRRILTWYNPLTWIWSGFTLQGKVVHIHWWTYVLFFPLFTLLLIAKFRGKRVSANVHNVLGHESGFLDRLFTRIFLRNCDMLIAHSERNRLDLIEQHRIPSAKITLAKLGVYKHLVQYEDKYEARDSLSLPKSSFIILAFGNIRKYKGTEYLLEAFARARQSSINLHLVIAGKPWIDWTPYQQIIDRLNLNEYITLRLEYIDSKNIPLYFSAADILVLPYVNFSSQSGIGLVGLGYSIPTIVTDVGGLPELVGFRKEFIARPSDSKELANKLVNIATSPKLQNEYRQLNTETIDAFAWDSTTQAIIDLYDM